MKILLLFFILLISTSYGLSQSEEANFPEISQDSLSKVYSRIDELSMPQLIKVQEMFRYKSRMEPIQQNRDILLYIDEKINELK